MNRSKNAAAAQPTAVRHGRIDKPQPDATLGRLALGYLRLDQILGKKEITAEQAAENRRSGKGPKRARAGIRPLFPVSRSSFYAGIKNGRYPKSFSLGPRTTAWRAADIQEMLDRMAGGVT